MITKDTLQWLAKHRHSGSWVLGVAALVSAVLWYLGDAGVTGMPPEWLILAVGCGLAMILNDIRD